MLRSEGAVILMNESNIQWIIGSSIPKYKVFEPYSDTVCSFLSDLSLILLKDKVALQYPDIISFAYFCRKANILKKKKSFAESLIRIGRGIIFHIAPSNVPVNFAFSFVFGLLAGNANVVRVPSKPFPHITIICNAISKVLENPEYADIKESTAFIRYGHDDDVTEYLSSICQGRIIWGGDSAITHIKKFPISHRSIEVSFSDRYSFAIINSDSVLQSDSKELEKLANAFYNDTYLMDQNACSSPQLIIWVGSSFKKAQNRFWKFVADAASKKYNLQPVTAVDKFTKLCSEAIDNSFVKSVNCYGNILYVADLRDLPEKTDTFRANCGYFYQNYCDDLNSITHIVNEKYQTLVYYGVAPIELSDFVTNNQLKGIDRIVPIGQALNIDVIWDGYDLIRTFSRVVDVR